LEVAYEIVTLPGHDCDVIDVGMYVPTNLVL
jgi:hypothetical protein